jgi:hypothetical protein
MENKKPCTICEKLILPNTFKKSGGLCIPCYKNENNGDMPSSMVLSDSEELERILKNRSMVEIFVDHFESAHYPTIDFTWEHYNKVEICNELSKFFHTNIQWVRDNQFKVNGKPYTFPLTSTHFDNKIITSSVYKLIANTKDIYIYSDGNWLLRLSNKDLNELKTKFGSFLKSKTEDDFYKPIDKFIPGYCCFYDIRYPMLGNRISKKEFDLNLMLNNIPQIRMIKNLLNYLNPCRRLTLSLYKIYPLNIYDSIIRKLAK